MAKFICRSSEEQLWQLIQAYSSRNGSKLVSTVDRSVELQYGMPAYGYIITLQTAPARNPNDTFLLVDLHLGSNGVWQRRVLMVLGLGLTTLFLLQINSLSCAAIAGLLIAIFGLVRYLIISSRSAAASQKALGRMLDDIRAVIKVQQAAPLSLSLPWFDAVILMPSLVLVFAMAALHMLGFPIGWVLSVPVFSGLTALAVARQHLESWRGALHSLQNAWLAMSTTWLVFLLVIVASSYSLRAIAESPNTQTMPGQFIGQIDRLIAHDMQRGTLNTGGIPEPTMLVTSISVMKPGLTLFFVISIAVCLGGVIMSITHSFADVRHWLGLFSASNDPKEHGICPDSPLFGWRDRTWIWINACMCGLTAWMCTAFSVAAICHIIGFDFQWGTPIVWSLRVFEAVLIERGLPPMAAKWILASTILTVTFPTVLFACMLATRAGTLFVQHCVYAVTARDVSQSPLCAHQSFIEKACRVAKVGNPLVVVLNRSPHPLMACSGMRGRYIIVSRRHLQVLAEPEIEALLAHEIAHLKWDVVILAWLKSLSLILLSPAYFLTILYNFAESETRADRFAAQVTGDPITIKHALIKLSASQAVSPDSVAVDWRPSARIIGSARRLFGKNWGTKWLSLIFGDALFAAAYPRLPERLALIDEEVVTPQPSGE